MVSFIVALCGVVIALLLGTVIQYRHSIIQYFRICNALKKFPSPPGHWFFGHILQLRTINEECVRMVEKRAISFDTCFVHWYSILPVLICNNAEAIKTVVKASSPKGNWFYDLARPWLGHGLLAINDQRWSRNRRLLTSAFHYDILKTYVQVYNDCVDVTIDKWNTLADQGKSFNIYDDLKLLTFDTIMQTAFSLQLNCQTSDKNHPYVLACRKLTRLLLQRIPNPLLHYTWIYRLTSEGKEFVKHCDFVNQFSDKIIQEKKQAFKANQHDKQYQQECQHTNKKKRLDFVDILLHTCDENGQELTAQEIRDEVNTFMFAGHDTTSTAIGWTLYCLAKYPHHQDKVREEAETILRNNHQIDHSDLSNLSYTHMCIKEAMRLYPIIPILERQLNQDLIINGKFVAKGTRTVLQLYTVCIRPEVWSNPHQYDPQRFAPENIQKRDSFDYLPFSAGPRNCIGKNFAINELKTVIARLIHHFEFQVDPNSPPRRLFAAVNQPDDGIWLKIKKRS